MSAAVSSSSKEEHKSAPKSMEIEMPDVAEEIPVGVTEADKMETIKLWSFAAPHMRGFHLAWFGFFIAFCSWFSVAPLMPAIKKTLHLNKMHIAYANLASVSTTILARVIMGPLVDKYGPKTTFCVLLVLGAIPVMCVGSIKSWEDLVIIRAAIGILGASFVMSQAWTTQMFKKSVVGTANAIVGGWGNLGGGVIQEVMVEIYGGFMDNGMTKEQAWRRSFYIPGAISMLTGVLIYFVGTDTPLGDMKDLKRRGVIFEKPASGLWQAATQYTTWIMALQYAASFGVEITVFNMAASYFHDDFHTTIVKAGKLASLAGITNIFARAMGGWFSDLANRSQGIKGRIIVQFVLVLLEGIFLVWFSKTTTYNDAVILMVVFSILVQAANGSCFALVPYINCGMGSASGLVGAGGNVGAMMFSLFFIFGGFAKTADGFSVMGYCVLGAAFCMLFVRPHNFKQDGVKMDPEVEKTVHVLEEGESDDASD